MLIQCYVFFFQSAHSDAISALLTLEKDKGFTQRANNADRQGTGLAVAVLSGAQLIRLMEEQLIHGKTDDHPKDKLLMAVRPAVPYAVWRVTNLNVIFNVNECLCLG